MVYCFEICIFMFLKYFWYCIYYYYMVDFEILKLFWMCKILEKLCSAKVKNLGNIWEFWKIWGWKLTRKGVGNLSKIEVKNWKNFGWRNWWFSRGCWRFDTVKNVSFGKVWNVVKRDGKIAEGNFDKMWGKNGENSPGKLFGEG